MGHRHISPTRIPKTDSIQAGGCVSAQQNALPPIVRTSYAPAYRDRQHLVPGLDPSWYKINLNRSKADALAYSPIAIGLYQRSAFLRNWLKVLWGGLFWWRSRLSCTRIGKFLVQDSHANQEGGYHATAA
jgi:hypothetical protein